MRRAIYDSQTSARNFVETLLANGGLTLANKEDVITRLDNGKLVARGRLRLQNLPLPEGSADG